MARAATATMVLAAALAVLLLAASSAPLASARRADPAAAAVVSHGQAAEEGSTAAGERGCEGANDEDECMMRRTLAAHTDYIYTQEHHN
ncbi:unnamed protein product [Urochloa humidicola]